MQSLSVLQLQNMLTAFCEHIIAQKQKINSINVFPVPDKDTGSNLAATFTAVHKVLASKRFDSITDLTETVEKTALYAAQGNSGIIFTGFIAGFFDSLYSQTSISPPILYLGFKKGAEKARSSIQHPKSGTILDVMDAVVVVMEKECAKKDCTLEVIFKQSFTYATAALEQTKEKMAVLKEADVVDAGGLAFVMMLESFYETITGKQLEVKEEKNTKTVENKSSDISVNRYEVIFILEEGLMEPAEIKEMLSELGDSIDIVDIKNSIKVHIHTDQPETVKEIAYSLGTIVFMQVMDMREEKIIELINKAT